ncbi:MAG: DUF4381 domain-containing protein [Lysobacterales bacterium]
MNPDLLSQLRDIHAAAPVSWWPPAPGWWVLALLLLVFLGWLGRRLMARFRVYQRRKQMLGWVEHLNANIDPQRDPQAYLSTLNRIFKLVAMRAFPAQQCAALNGQDWVNFLIENMKKSSSAESLAVLATGPYDPAPTFDPELMSELTRNWIRQHG